MMTEEIVSNNMKVFRDRVGNYIFIDADNTQETHYSVWDKTGSKLVRRGQVAMNPDVLMWYMKNVLHYTVEDGGLI